MEPSKKRIGKKKNEEKKKLGIVEPVRKTMYDVLVENLRLGTRKTYLHRLIYMGRQDFITSDIAFQFFTETVTAIEGIESITGVYLHYPKLFIHIIESDEYTINKHLNYLYRSEMLEFLSDLKLLGHFCHINVRMLPSYTCLIALPRLLINPPVHSDNETIKDAGFQIFNCVKKIYTLLTNMGDPKKSTTMCSSLGSARDLSKDGSKLSFGYETTHSKTSVSGSRFLEKSSPYRDFFPESELIEYILLSRFTPDLIGYLNLTKQFYQKQELKDKVWPIPADMMQYNIFDKTYDRKVDMPIHDRGAQRGFQKADEDEAEGDDMSNE